MHPQSSIVNYQCFLLFSSSRIISISLMLNVRPQDMQQYPILWSKQILRSGQFGQFTSWRSGSNIFLSTPFLNRKYFRHLPKRLSAKYTQFLKNYLGREPPQNLTGHLSEGFYARRIADLVLMLVIQPIFQNQPYNPLKTLLILMSNLVFYQK